MRKPCLVLSLLGVLGAAAVAQEMPRATFNIGGGFTNPMQSTRDKLDTGWNISAGAGVNLHPNFAVMAQFNYNAFDVNTATLNSIGFPNGTVRIPSATLNGVIHTSPRGPVDLYFIGGGGLYHWHQEFTVPSVTTFTGFDPYFGVFYPVAVPVNQVVSSYSINKPGWNGGAGLSFGTRWHTKVYAEARFHRIILGADRYADMLPVTFGLRW